MRKLLILPFFLLVLLALPFAFASADSQQVQHDWTDMTTGDSNFFVLTGLCNECLPNDLDLDGSSFEAIGFEVHAHGSFSWEAISTDSVISYNPNLLRQGSTLNAVDSMLSVNGMVHVHYQFEGTLGIHTDPDGDGPAVYQATPFVLPGWLMVYDKNLPCPLPVVGGPGVCSSEDFIVLANLNLAFVNIQLRIRLETTVEVDSTGVIGVRTVAVQGGAPIADAPVSFVGLNPALFFDPVGISCTQPVDAEVNYALKDLHWSTNSVHMDHTAHINFAVTDPLSIVTFWNDDLPVGFPIADVYFNQTLQTTTPDSSIKLGKILPDMTKPTIDSVGGPYSGVEGSPIQFGAQASDNCGAPTLRWDFSDGGVAFGANPQHTFTDNGVYSALITATDVTGLSTQATLSINVSNATPSVSAGPDKTYDWGKPVPFHANGADDGAQDNLSLLYTWTFGDPNDPLGAAGQDVAHTFAQPGIYSPIVVAKDKDGASSADALEVTVTRRDTSLGYTGANTGKVTDAILLRAALVDEYGQAVVGRSVTFRVDGTAVGSALTNAFGVAQMTWSIPLGTSIGLHSVGANFAQDGFYNASDSLAFVTFLSIEKETTVVTYTGVPKSKPSKPVTLSATLTDDEGNAIAGKTVTFTLGSQSCSGATNGLGVVSCTIAKLSQQSGVYSLVTTFAGNADYLPANDTDSFTIGN